MKLFLSILFLVTFSTTMAQQFIDVAGTNNIQKFYGSSGIFGGGVSFCDFNGDGLDDISFASAAGDSLNFYQNNGNGFTKMDFGISDTNEVKQINWVDVDNDGDKDLFITRLNLTPKIYRNNGGMSFSDATISAGFLASVKAFGSSWGDINNDGFLDVFVCVNKIDTINVTGNQLYLNNGDFTFSNISTTSGIEDFNDLSFCAALIDFNLDGWLDIYIANDKNVANELFKNNGDLTFTSVGLSSNTDIIMNAMSTTIGDYNYDGYPDFYTTNTHAGNVMLRNNGDETFLEVADSLGVAFNSIGWGAVFLDGDNDMNLDLYVSGMLGPSSGFLPSAYYERMLADTFVLQTLGFELDTATSFSNAIGDLNNDGFPDIAVSNKEPINHFVYQNVPNANHWIKINLEGTISNRDAIGARIELSSGGQLQYNFTLLGEGFLGQNSMTEFFGIGLNTTIDSITIYWPSGLIDKVFSPAIDQTLDLIEGFSLGLSELNNQFIVYPNPSLDGVFFIENSSSELITEISVFNSLGQKITTELSMNNSLNIKEFGHGIYYIHILNSSSNSIIKVVY